MSQKTMWMVRAGEQAKLFKEFKSKKIIAIGWNELGDLSKFKDYNELKIKVRQIYPGKEGNVSITSGQLSRFKSDFKKGDGIITYDPQNRIYLVGEITGDYEWNKEECEYFNIRKVKWLNEVSRDKLSITTKNTLGAISTLFEVGEDAEKEIMGLTSNDKQESAIAEENKSDDGLGVLKEDIKNQAREFIKDKVSNLSWEDAQRLVAGILRGMGYKTKVSPPGSDRGKDVVASKDSLGLEGTRIVVEVKHRNGQMGSKEIRSFLAILRNGEKGVYVSTGGFSKDAKYEGERANIPITMLDLDDLVDLVIQYYDEFDTETRLLIPLTKLYWPE